MPQVTIAGTRIHYVDEGAGEPAVVLIHAFPLHSGMWTAQIEALTGRARVVAPDLPGFGQSEAPEDPAAYSIDAYADQMAGLLDHLGIGPVAVCGLSLGGYVAFAFLRRHRDRLAALVLADTRPGVDSPEVRERRTRQQEQVREQGTRPVIDALVETLLSEPTRRDRPQVEARTRALMDNPPAGFVGALEAMKRRADSTAELAAVDVPTLVVVGEHDGPSPPDVAEAMHRRIPGSRLVVVPGAGHLTNLERPDDFNAALGAFLDELAPSGATAP